MSIKCEKELKYEISGYDAETLLEVCELARVIIYVKKTLPNYMEKERIDRFITAIFHEENIE